MSPEAPIVSVRELSVDLDVGGTQRAILRDISLEIAPGKALALVGESGAGKSMTGRAIARILPDLATVTGSVTVCGQDLMTLSGSSLRRARENVAVIFQDPRVHVNPVRRVGDFMTEQLRFVRGLSTRDASQRAIAALEEVGIGDGARRLDQYPHELSGGLLQRVMIASALLGEPRLLIADEPTTALDVTTQSEVMAIIDELRKRHALAMLFITHDLDLAAAVCDHTAVMYAGRIVEVRESGALHGSPAHPYSAALGAARPDLNSRADRLRAIEGRPVACWQAPAGCAFAPRCSYARPQCTAGVPPLRALDAGSVRCVRAQEIRGALEPEVVRA